MLPTRSTWFSLVLFFITECILIVAAARSLNIPVETLYSDDDDDNNNNNNNNSTKTHSLSDNEEGAMWLVVCSLLFVASVLLYTYMYYTHFPMTKGKKDNSTKVAEERALAKLDRNALSFVNYTLFINAYSLLFAILTVADVVLIRWLRTLLAAQSGLLPALWLASVIPYSTLRESTQKTTTTTTTKRA